MGEWSLQEAKNKFSVLVDEALTEGPQYVTRHDRKAVVVMALDEYQRTRSPSVPFKEFLRSLPLEGVNLEREETSDRDVSLGAD